MKILLLSLLSVHSLQGCGSAHFSQDLAIRLRSLGHYILQNCDRISENYFKVYFQAI